MNASVLSCRSRVSGVAILIATISLSGVSMVRAGEQRIVLRDYIKQEWKNELVTFPFSAPKGECHPDSVTMVGPRGAVPVQLSEIECWPETDWVKSAKLSFIADLSPLAKDNYTVRYDTKPVAPSKLATDLTVTSGDEQVEITTGEFGVRLLQGDKKYHEPASVADVSGPVIGMRLADGTWFGGSRMFGTSKIASYSA